MKTLFLRVLLGMVFTLPFVVSQAAEHPGSATGSEHPGTKINVEADVEANIEASVGQDSTNEDANEADIASDEDESAGSEHPASGGNEHPQ